MQFRHGDFEAAIENYSKAIMLDPEFGEAYNNRCLVLVVVGRDLSLARHDCQEAVRLLPNRGDIRETLGFVHLKLGEPLAALVEYNNALQFNNHSAVALFGRGLAKEQLGDLKGAKIDFNDAREILPSVEFAFGNYGFWW